MNLIQSILLSSILCLICVEIIDCKPKKSSSDLSFCSIKTFDSIFNMGHLIYFFRCGQMFTYDTKLSEGKGEFLRDYSPLVVSRQYCSSQMIREQNGFYFDYMNITAFSFQGLNCVHKDEDSRGMCKRSTRAWNHLTFFICDKLMYAFHYDTDYKPQTEGVSPLAMKFEENLNWDALNPFFPKITDIANKRFKFNDQNMSIKYLLFNPIRYYLLLAIKHKEYYCVTYLDMGDMLFSEQHWPTLNGNTTRQKWKKGNCFKGEVRGMFFQRSQAFIVGQVLEENRVYDNQIYKVMANGKSRVKFIPMNHKIGNDSYEPQTVHRFFGCDSSVVRDIIDRKKRSLQEPIETDAQKTKSIIVRVANNLLIRIMVFLFVFVLIYKLFGTQFKRKLQQKIYYQIF